MKRAAVTAVIVLALAVLTGCVRRTLAITSTPPGALVYVNGDQKGDTPVDVEFDFYGDFLVELKKDGYQYVSEIKRIDPPFYEVFPLDFISEILIPFEIKDEHELHYTLVEHTFADKEGLLDRGRETRRELLGPKGPATPPAGDE